MAPLCAGYMRATNESLFLKDDPPKAVPCANQTLNGWGPPQHQASSCCDEVSRYLVQFGVVGGFGNLPGRLTGKGSLIPDNDNDKMYNAQCAPYIDNLKATLCDPLQGQYVQHNITSNQTVFRICKNSCDLVYQQCKDYLPNMGVLNASSVHNGTEFCFALWGRVYYTEEGSEIFVEENICEILNNSDLMVCSFNLELQVDQENCLSVIAPSQADVESYRFNGYPIDACVPPAVITDTQLGAIIVVSVVAALVFVTGFILFSWIQQRRNAEQIADNI